MDFCQEFRTIDSLLGKFQRSSGSLLNQIDKKVACDLIKTLKAKLFANSINETLKRRITLYLILQTDLMTSEQLEENFEYGLLVKSQMNGSLLVLVVWGLGLQKYFCETILYGPHALGEELTKLVVAASLSVDDCIVLAGDLASTIFNKIRRMEQIVEAVEQTFKGNVVTKFIFHFRTLLQALVVHESKFGSLLEEEDRANRRRLQCILKLTRLCFSQPDDNESPHAAVYQIDLKFDYSDWKNDCNLTLSDLTHTLIEECTACVKNSNISTSLWCKWVEIDSEVEGKSFQKFIGEEMYNCMLALENSCTSEASELISILRMMSIKPETEDDEIRRADFQTILDNVWEESRTHSKWLAALLKVGADEALFEDCLLSIERSVPIQYELINVAIDFVVRCLKSPNGSVCRRRLKHLALESLKSFSPKEQVEAMKRYFEEYGITTMLMTDEFTQVFTEVFNKAVSQSANLKEERFLAELINLCIQSPEDLFMKMLKEGMMNANQTLLMIKVFKILRPICQLPGVDEDVNKKEKGILIKIIMKFLNQMEFRDHEETNFVHLITSLATDCVINRDILLESCIVPMLRQCLLTHQWNIATLCLRILRTINKDMELKKLIPLVVMLSQVMDLSRCNLLNFTSNKSLVCEEACIIIKSIVTRLRNAGDLLDNRHIQWIEHKTSGLEAINKSYFFKLRGHVTTNLDSAINVSAESLIMNGIQSGRIDDEMLAFARVQIKKEDMVLNLVQILPKLSSREWLSLSCLKHILVDSEGDDGVLNLFHLLADSLMLINGIVKSQFGKNQHTLSCISLCIRNFARFIQDEVLKPSPSDTGDKSGRWLKPSSDLQATDLKVVFQKMLLLLESLPDHIKEPSSIFLMTLMTRMLCDVMCLESVGKDSCPEETILQLCSLISLSSVRDVRVVLAREIAEKS